METVKRRNNVPRDADTGNSMADQEDEGQVEEQQRGKWNALKYYFNRIRYYHYYIAEKVDTLIGVVCLTIIKIYSFLMGWNDQYALQDDEMMNVRHSVDITDIIHATTAAYTEEEEILLEAYTHILKGIGSEKILSARLPKILNHWLKIPQDKLNIIEDIGRLFWVSDIIMEDIQNNSATRDNISAAHIVYGVPGVLSTAYYISSIAIKRARQLNHPEAIRIFSKYCIEIDRGQYIYLYWKDNYICPTEIEFKVMAVQRYGIFSMIASLMQLFSDYKEDLTMLIGILALYLQIRNDYLDFYGEKYTEGKEYCSDLTAGYFNFLIVHAIRTSPKAKLITRIVKNRTKEDTVKRHCLNLLKKYGTYAYTRAVLDELDTKAREEVQFLGGNPLFDQLLNELQSWKH